MSATFSPLLHIEKPLSDAGLYHWDGLGCHRNQHSEDPRVSVILSSLEKLKDPVLAVWAKGSNFQEGVGYNSP